MVQLVKLLRYATLQIGIRALVDSDLMLTRYTNSFSPPLLPVRSCLPCDVSNATVIYIRLRVIAIKQYTPTA